MSPAITSRLLVQLIVQLNVSVTSCVRWRGVVSRQVVWLSSRGEAVWSRLTGAAHSRRHGTDEQRRSQELSPFTPRSSPGTHTHTRTHTHTHTHTHTDWASTVTAAVVSKQVSMFLPCSYDHMSQSAKVYNLLTSVVVSQACRMLLGQCWSWTAQRSETSSDGRWNSRRHGLPCVKEVCPPWSCSTQLHGLWESGCENWRFVHSNLYIIY